MCIDYNNARIDRKYSECLDPFAIACSSILSARVANNSAGFASSFLRMLPAI